MSNNNNNEASFYSISSHFQTAQVTRHFHSSLKYLRYYLDDYNYYTTKLFLKKTKACEHQAESDHHPITVRSCQSNGRRQLMYLPKRSKKKTKNKMWRKS